MNYSESTKVMLRQALRWLSFLLPAAILGSLGCLLVHLHANGDLTFLQHRRFHEWTLITGWALIASALIYPLMYEPNNAPIRSSFRSLALQMIFCALPVALALLYPLNYDLTTLAQRVEHKPFDPAMLVSESERHVVPQWLMDAKERGSAEPSLVDLIVASHIPDARADLDGLEVVMTGQWLAETADSFRFVRLFMFCCAADARPIGLTVKGAPPKLDSGAWIELRGRLRLEPDAKTLPVIELISVDPTDAPEDAFVY